MLLKNLNTRLSMVTDITLFIARFQKLLLYNFSKAFLYSYADRISSEFWLNI